MDVVPSEVVEEGLEGTEGGGGFHEGDEGEVVVVGEGDVVDVVGEGEAEGVARVEGEEAGRRPG